MVKLLVKPYIVLLYYPSKVLYPFVHGYNLGSSYPPTAKCLWGLTRY